MTVEAPQKYAHLSITQFNWITNTITETMACIIYYEYEEVAKNLTIIMDGVTIRYACNDNVKGRTTQDTLYVMNVVNCTLLSLIVFN